MSYILFQASLAAETPRELERAASFGEWIRHDIQYCRFKNYDLTYALYTKFPSWGSAVARSLSGEPLMGARCLQGPYFLPHSLVTPIFPSICVMEVYICGISDCNAREFATTLLSSVQFILPGDNSGCCCSPVISSSVVVVVVIVMLRLIVCVLSFNPGLLFSWWRNKISWRRQEDHVIEFCLSLKFP